jgi:hypothetical protein
VLSKLHLLDGPGLVNILQKLAVMGCNEEDELIFELVSGNSRGVGRDRLLQSGHICTLVFVLGQWPTYQEDGGAGVVMCVVLWELWVYIK